MCGAHVAHDFQCLSLRCKPSSRLTLLGLHAASGTSASARRQHVHLGLSSHFPSSPAGPAASRCSPQDQQEPLAKLSESPNSTGSLTLTSRPTSTGPSETLLGSDSPHLASQADFWLQTATSSLLWAPETPPGRAQWAAGAPGGVNFHAKELSDCTPGVIGKDNAMEPTLRRFEALSGPFSNASQLSFEGRDACDSSTWLSSELLVSPKAPRTRAWMSAVPS